MKSDEKQSLERILESAIVVSWPDLIGEAQTGLIHIEYGFAPTGTLDYLKVWSSLTRGHWLLACEYWMSASTFHGTGVRFDNGYESEALAHILEFVMRQQSEFALPTNRGRRDYFRFQRPPKKNACKLVSGFTMPSIVSAQLSPSPRWPEASGALTFPTPPSAGLDADRCGAGPCSTRIFRPVLRHR